MRVLPLLVLALAFAAILMTPRWAGAQEASEQAAAQALFDEGMRLFGEAKFAESCSKFEASLALVDGMGTRGKLAECYEKVGRTASAWAAYREVAVLAKRAGQSQRERIANERAARLQASLAYLTIVVPGESRVEGLQVLQNGVPLNVGAFGTAIATDPGTQTIELRADGYREQTLRVELGKSETRTVEIPRLEALPLEVPPESGPEELERKPMIPEPEPVPAAKATSTLRIVGISSVAVGASAILASAILGIKAKSDYDAAFDDGSCNADNTCTPAGLTTIDDARGLANIATVAALAGTVLVGAGAYLWLRTPGAATDEVQSVTVAPTANAESLGLSLTGRF
jgi:hypothetical protein